VNIHGIVREYSLGVRASMNFQANYLIFRNRGVLKFSRKKDGNLSADNMVLSSDNPKCYQLITS
jgi:hypothetical protein